MLDGPVRAVLAGPLDRVAGVLAGTRITPLGLTLTGLALGVGSAAASALQAWSVALVLWLVSRLADGLDGPLARRRARAGTTDAGAGGFADITADFCVYGATVLGVAVGAVGGEGAAWQPFAVLLLAYYVNGTAFLAYSSIAERAGRTRDSGRSLSFLGGLAEGTETIAVHTLWLLLPGSADLIAAVWAGVVGVTVLQRVVTGYRALR